MGFFPDDYRYADSDKNSSTQSNDIYWKPSKLEAGSKAEIRMLGGENAFKDGYVIAGYEYFTRDGVSRTPTYPSKWRDNAGLAYQYRELSPEAKEDKYKEIAAMPQEEQVKHLNAPKAFLSFVACIKGEPKLQVVTITQRQIRAQLEEYLNMPEDFTWGDNGVANFKFSLSKKGSGKDTTYVTTATPFNRALPKDLASEWDDKKAEIYLRFSRVAFEGILPPSSPRACRRLARRVGAVTRRKTPCPPTTGQRWLSVRKRCLTDDLLSCPD